MSRYRRWSQILFLALFLLLLFRTEFRGSLRGAGGEIRLPLPVGIFLQADPLAAVSNALASRALYRGLLWSLAILVPTLFLGRFFCGWICPLGTLNHFFSRKKRGRALIHSNRYRPWYRLKYYVLIAGLAAALFGSGILGLLDPISLAVRSLALSVLPAVNYGLNAIFDRLLASNVRPLQFLGIALHFVLQSTVVSFKQPYFRQGFFLGLLLVAVLALNLRLTRFWCRALCPLGALLGVVSRWSIFGLEKRAGECGDCNRCLLGCQGGDDPIPGARWRKAECHLCFNCTAACPEGVLRFKFFPASGAAVAGPDLRRRSALTALAAGVAMVPALRSTTGLAAERHERLLRPPGALDERDFLARCIRCGECMKVCPNNALQPALAQAGFEGLWTPVLVPRIGYCEPSCVLCGQVCPSGAIWEITARDKGWIGAAAKPVRLGTAFYDRGRCLPWAMATECIVCEEWCPTSPKAIFLREAEAPAAAGGTQRVRQPYLEPERCVGCGACEYACPVQDRPAIYVTSIGESRSPSHQMMLSSAKPKAAPALLPESGEAPGWTKRGATRAFEASNLWQYIDGDAERYLRAGVERALTSAYRYQERIDAVADVYVMQAASGAAAVFDAEPAQGSRPAAVGEAGRAYTASLTFHRGCYFVRLTAYQDAAGPLLELARAIERRLK